MPTITLSVPEDLKEEMDESKEINWSEVARSAIREKVAQLRILKTIIRKSKLEQKDADAIAREIKKAMHKKYLEEHQEAY